MDEQRLSYAFGKAEKRMPAILLAGLKRYYYDKIPTGTFLRAVLENNLSQAILGADSENLKLIYEIVSFIYDELPENCWGSPEKVANWLNKNPIQV